ncbi:MAG: hypothetical protein ACLRSW_12830 [Christensenellaceae bacterium]
MTERLRVQYNCGKVAIKEKHETFIKAHYGLNVCCVLAGMYREGFRPGTEEASRFGQISGQMMRLLASRGMSGAARRGGRIRWRGARRRFGGAVVRAGRRHGLSTARRRRACKNASSAAVWQKFYRRSTGCWTMTLSDMLKGEI